MRGLDVVAQERPGLASDLVRQVDPDVTAPDHGRARFEQGLDQAGRLRVVAEDDIAGAHGPRQLAGARAQRLLVDLPLCITELAAVARRAVEAVVNPLRHLEEGRRPVDHDPARIDARPAGVAEQ